MSKDNQGEPDTPLQPVKDEDIIKKIAWAAWKEVYIQNTSYPDINDPDKPQEYDWSWVYDSEFTTWWDVVGKKFLPTADMGNPVTELSSPPDPSPLKEGLPDQKEGERKFRTALEWLLDAIPGQTNDADWWPDELTTAVKNAKLALDSPAEPSSKEQEGDVENAIAFAQFCSKKNIYPNSYSYKLFKQKP